SYAGSTTRLRDKARSGDGRFARRGAIEPIADTAHDSVDWGRMAAFAAGILVGAIAGASTALLMAPQSGWETRDQLSRQARRVRGRAVDTLDDWGYDVRRKARKTRRRARRALNRDE